MKDYKYWELETYEVRKIEISFTVTQLSAGVTDRQADGQTDGHKKGVLDVQSPQ